MTLQRDPEGNEKKYLHEFADFKNKRVLEIGCGEGRLTWKYASAARLTMGLDTDHDALRVARVDSPSDLRKRVCLAEADAKNIPAPRETFDIALLAWSL